MPSTYVHYRFGQEIRAQLSGAPRKAIEAWPELYLIGIHGPDILFYYRALFKNAVNATGYRLHAEPGRAFFAAAKKAIASAPSREAALSYAYGVLDHFALDMSCHGYVDEKIAASGVTHTEIEVEFDRSLMLADGLDPVRHSLTDHIRPSAENAAVIAPFYPGVTPAQVQKALKSMIFQNRFLLARTGLKRHAIYAVLRLTGNYKEMHGLIVNPKGNPACADSNVRLLELYGLAKTRAIDFISEFDGYLRGEAKLDPLFDYTFGGKLIESGDPI